MIAGWFRYPPEIAVLLTGAVDAQVTRALRGQHAPAGADTSRRVVSWPSLGQQRADALLAVQDRCAPCHRKRHAAQRATE